MRDNIENVHAVANTPSRVRPDGTSEAVTLEVARADATTGSPRDRAIALEQMAHAATLPHEDEVGFGGPHCQRCEVLPGRWPGLALCT